MKIIVLIATLISFNTFSLSLESADHCFDNIENTNPELIQKLTEKGTYMAKNLSSDFLARFDNHFEDKLIPDATSCDDLIAKSEMYINKIYTITKELNAIIE